MSPHLFLLTLIYIKEGYGVTINSLRVPQEVQNGTNKGVILDCDYTLKPEELSPMSGLVVKWFFNSSPDPIYQWIPSNKPQDLGLLRGRLKLDYEASKNRATMHRALYIRNPTTELSGEYKCFISTFADEDFMIKRMVVFAPEKRLEVHTKTDIQGVNITCRALGVYPEPKMFLFKGTDTKNLEPMEGVSVETSMHSGEYDIVANGILQEEELNAKTIVDCELRIPDTSYVKRKTLHYYPGRALPWTDSGGGTRRVVTSLVVLTIVWFTIIC